MRANNVTKEITALFATPVAEPFFLVQATEEIITTRGRHISGGDIIVIDPLQSPGNDQMVLVGNSIQPFICQPHCGTVYGFMSETV